MLSNKLRWLSFVLKMMGMGAGEKKALCLDDTAKCIGILKFPVHIYFRIDILISSNSIIHYLQWQNTYISVWTYFQLSTFIIFITQWHLPRIFYPSGNSSHEIPQTEIIPFCCKSISTLNLKSKHATVGKKKKKEKSFNNMPVRFSDKHIHTHWTSDFRATHFLRLFFVCLFLLVCGFFFLCLVWGVFVCFFV